MAFDAFTLKFSRNKDLRQLHFEEGVERSNPSKTSEAHVRIANLVRVCCVPFFIEAQPAVLTATQLSKKEVTSSSVARCSCV